MAGANHQHEPAPQYRSAFFRAASLRTLLPVLAAVGVAACSTLPPQGVTPVSPFDVERYKGKWYEIARLDHSFERGLTNVSATYRPQADGSVEVINRGYDAEEGKWREAVGRAVFHRKSDRGSLKVSFFGPFYGGYHVVAPRPAGLPLAMVMGPIGVTCGYSPGSGSRPRCGLHCCARPSLLSEHRGGDLGEARA